MHPIGQILHFDNKIEFEGRWVKQPHAVLYLMDVSKIGENHDDEVTSFLDKIHNVSLPDEYCRELN